MRWAWQTAVILGALGAKGTITGTKECNEYICITGLHDSEKNLDSYTLSPPEDRPIIPAQVGYMAMGFGRGMLESPMIIVWPNTDGSVTLSHRQASDYAMPRVVDNPVRQAFPTESRISASANAAITLSLSSQNATNNETPIIWAYSTENPQSSDPRARIAHHDWAGMMVLNLLAPYQSETEQSQSTSSSSPLFPTRTAVSRPGDFGRPNGPNGISSSEGRTNTVLIAHAVCGAIATMILLPIGVLVPRVARGLTTRRWWFPTHGAVNGLLAGVLIVTAFGIARVNFHKHGGFSTGHRQAGLAFFLLTLMQIALGIFTHWYKAPHHRLKTESGRGPTNFIHMVLGCIVVVLGWITVWKGIDAEWPTWSTSGELTMLGWKIAWGVIVGLSTLAYLFGLVFMLPKQMALERQGRLRKSGISNPHRWTTAQGSQEVEMSSGMKWTGRADEIWAGRPIGQDRSSG